MFQNDEPSTLFGPGDAVVIRRRTGGRPNRGAFTILSAGLADRDGARYYRVRSLHTGQDRVVHQNDLSRPSNRE
jgi:hypothetical protein